MNKAEELFQRIIKMRNGEEVCLLYTSDAADD